MKKHKITLSDGETKTKYFYLFPESTILHNLIKKSSRKNLNNLLKTHPEVEVITLKRNQWFEVEWNGCHIEYIDNQHVSAAFLRLIKATSSPKKINDGSLISVHFGWMLSDHLRLIDGIKDGIKIQTLSEEDEQFEFSELFQDNETIEDIMKKHVQCDVN
jgi:hypothetical protein